MGIDHYCILIGYTGPDQKYADVLLCLPDAADSLACGKKIEVEIFSKQNTLGSLGLLFTMNQMLYLLIVMWVYAAVPEKMIMVYAMVFGAHLLPYSWLYRSKAYMIFAIVIPFIALFLGIRFNGSVVASVLMVAEAVFVWVLFQEVKQINKR